MLIKDQPVKVKAGPDDGLAEGQFQAYASVFNNVDSGGDVVQPGAFTDTLAEWKASGSPIPLLWGHNMADPDYNIGYIVTAEQDEKGLFVTGQFDMDSPKAAQTYRLVKGGRVNQMSFAYDVLDGGVETKDGESVYALRTLKLYEVSITPIGMNQDTEILAVKAMTALADGLTGGLKTGRVLAQKHLDSLRSAHDAIGAVLAAADLTDDQDKTSGNGPSKAAEPVQPAPETSLSPSVKTLATLQIQLAALAAEGGSQ